MSFCVRVCVFVDEIDEAVKRENELEQEEQSKWKE